MNIARTVVRYAGLAMAVLGGMGLLSGRNLPLWLVFLLVGLAIAGVAKIGQADSTTEAAAQDADPIKPLHYLAIVTVYVAIPWGIVNLVRKKRRTGLFLIVGEFVWLAIAFAFVTGIRVMMGLTAFGSLQ